MPYTDFPETDGRDCPTCGTRQFVGYYNPRTDRWDKQCAGCSTAVSAAKRDRIRAAKAEAKTEAEAAKPKQRRVKKTVVSPEDVEATVAAKLAS